MFNISKIRLIVNQVYLKTFDFCVQIANIINTGKQTKMYLGILEKVPVKVGIINASKEKIT